MVVGNVCLQYVISLKIMQVSELRKRSSEKQGSGGDGALKLLRSAPRSTQILLRTIPTRETS